MFKSNRGQLSIFLGITLILVMGMLAFIINVGLFVKAKINLQNSVDAAAFSGASVQARQLTNIAYLNWEMRNNYKEWMFKYYVLGQISSLRKIPPNDAIPKPFPLEESLKTTNGVTDFSLRTLGPVRASDGSTLWIGGGSASEGPKFDHYNVPSICIHNSASTDICPSYFIPGLPRFPAIGVSGVSEINEAAVTDLVAAKAADCSNRTKQNYGAALLWAYGEGVPNPPPTVPALMAADRPGAWPRAIELSMRMRNLEMIVNYPPQSALTYGAVKNMPSEAGADIALKERPYKAFMSAFKNLSGGVYKENGKDEMTNTFTLTEISPQPYKAEAKSISGYLIPDGISPDPLTKYYLDLQAVPLNLATMFSSFATTTNDIMPGLTSEASCGISKTALPVPGFIMGFIKNPIVMTYYAVKGESKFIGLFSPFKNTVFENGVTLTAYAAAKPFGGRIGPKLFSFSGGGGGGNYPKSVVVRDNDESKRSLSMIYGLKIPPPVDTTKPFNPGDPIPVSQEFWISSGVGGLDQGDVGGIADIGRNPYFGIPNLIYDYVNINPKQTSTANPIGSKVVDIQSKNVIGPATLPTLGLYDTAQYKLLKDSLPPSVINTNSYTSIDILNGIVKARRATKYDAVNYLVPDYKHTEIQNALPFISVETPPASTEYHFYNYKIFAPLLNQNLLYRNANDINNAIGNYLTTMEGAVKQYEKALFQVAQSIYNLTTATSNGTQTINSSVDSAKTIHINVPNGSTTPPMLVEGSCTPDIASRFHYFFQQTQATTVCTIKPLKAMMIDFINAQKTGDKSNYFHSEYYTGTPGQANEVAINQDSLLTGYFPGPRQGVAVGNPNLIHSPLDTTGTGSPYNSRRNYYSTKFISLAQVTENSQLAMNETALRERLEKSSTANPELASPPINLIKNDTASGIGGNFFLDF